MARKEYIEREAVNALIKAECSPKVAAYLIDAVATIPAADVVPMSWVREHMSGDYISRKNAVENVLDQMRHSKSETAMRERLLNMVAADVRPVVRGRWIPVTNGRGGNECSECHCYALSYQSGDECLSNFCPNCGADCRGDNDGKELKDGGRLT